MVHCVLLNKNISGVVTMCEDNYDFLECGHFSDKVGNACRECISERNCAIADDRKVVPERDISPVYSVEYRIHNQANNFRHSIRKRNDLARVRARRAGQESPSNFTPEDIERLLIQQDHSCLACFTPFTECVMEIDHKLPMEYGGTNDIKNLQLLCKSCNIVKGRQDNANWLSGIRHKQVISYLEEIQEEESYAV